MNKVKKVIVLLLVVAVGSLSLIGCKDKHEHPEGEHPTTETSSEETPAPDHPKGEHPKGELPK